ncbi:hypothetical protein L7F22_032194 [Adiantum nelumboides]|nr:hypothetical protein [Adiantum nelumboides]
MFACCGSLLEANFVFSQMQSASIDAWQAIIEAHNLLCHNNLAIILYFRMKSEGLLPSRCTVLCVLGSCTREQELIYGRIINDDVIRAGQSLDVAIGSRLVDMYAKCSSLEEAQKVFDNLPSRNVVTWNSLIAGYAMAGEIATVFIFLEKMKKDNLCPVGVTFLCVLKACNVLRSMESGNMICMEILKYGWDLNALVGNSLVDLYAKCGHLQEAHAVFMRLRSQDVVSWNALISGYVKVKDCASALELFWRMQKEGVNPDAYTFSCAFQACGNIKEGEQGDALHNYFLVSGLEMDTHVGSTLLYMYATLNKLEEARRVFDGFSNANSVMWGMMIAGYSQHGHHICGLELFRRMQGVSIKPDAATFPFILISCGNLTKINPGMVAHNEVILRHFEAELEICNSLIDMYSKCGYLREAQRMSDYMLIRDKVTWNSLITGYAQQEDSMIALRLFKRMQQENIMADKVSLLGAIKCCASAGTVFQAMQLHHNAYHDDQEVDMLLGSSLVDVYAKLGCLVEARFVFTRLPSLDVVSCSAMVSGYAQQGFWFQSTHVYDLMVQKNIKPDNISFACVLKACSHIGNMNGCMLLHDEIVRVDLASDALVGNALIDMYVKGGMLSEARYVFNSLPERTLASWNTIMMGYAEHDDGFQVLELFELLQQEGVCPNKVSYLCVLKACSSLGSIVYGFFVHDHIVRNSLETDLVVSNMIIDTYGRCGGLEEAHTVFDRLINQDVVSWSALIAGYAQHRGLELAQQYLLLCSKAV